MLDKIKRKVYWRFSFYQVLTFIFFFLIIGGLSLAHVIWAGDAISVQYQVPFGGISSGDLLPEYINKIYKWMIGAGLVLVGIMITIGGFMYLSSGGDSKTIASGKKYIINSLIGMLLLTSAYLILNTINPDATSLEVIKVAEIEQREMGTKIEVPYGCECNSNKDCVNAVTDAYFCDYSGGGQMVYSAYRKNIVTQTADKYVNEIIIAVVVTAVIFGTSGLGSFTLLSKLGRATFQVGKVVTKASWNVVKFTGKWLLGPSVTLVVTNPEIAIVAALYFIGGGANFNLGTEFAQTCNKPSGEVKGVCLPNIFRYGRLRPHGWGNTDLVKNGNSADKLGIFGIYNADGSLPPREKYFQEARPLTTILDDSNNKLVDVQHEYKNLVTQGVANTDACMSFITDYKENYCPCLEWESGKEFIKCKRQAACVKLKATGTYAGAVADNKELCLTGTKGELCRDDNDCINGLKCVNLKDIGKDVYGDNWKVYADQHSLFRQALGAANSSDGYLSYSSISSSAKSNDLDRDRVCMPVGQTDVKVLKESSLATLYRNASTGCKDGLTKTNVTLDTCYSYSSGGYINNTMPICGGDFSESNFNAGKIKKIDSSYLDKILKFVANETTPAVAANLETVYGPSNWGDRTVADNVRAKFSSRYYYNSSDSGLSSCTFEVFNVFNKKYIDQYKDNFNFYKKIGNDYYFVFMYINPEKPEGDTSRYVFYNACKSVNPTCDCDVKLGFMAISMAVANDWTCTTSGAILDYPYIRFIPTSTY